MLLSVIIPVYNAAPYLKRCLSSILCQLDGEAEVICVDDGSSDGSGAILDEMAGGALRVIHQENGGVSSARNRGLAAARGDYIAWVDADDYVAPTWYEAIRAGIASGAEVVTFDLCRLEKGRAVPQVYGGPARFLDRDAYLTELFLDKKVRNYLWNRAFARRLFDGISFPEHVAAMEDYSVLHELIYRAKGIYYTAQVLYFYEIHGGSLSQRCDLSACWQGTRIARGYYDWLVERGIEAPAEGYLKHDVFFMTAVLQQGQSERYEKEISLCRQEIRRHALAALEYDIGVKEKVKYMMLALHMDFIYKIWYTIKFRGGKCSISLGMDCGAALC